MNTVWDVPGVLAFVRRLWERGRSASQIVGDVMAEHRILLSRNSVIAKMYRAKLYRAKVAAQKPAKPKSTSKHGNLRHITRGPTLVCDGVSDLLADQSPHACGILQLRINSCRWVLGEPTADALYCGTATRPHSPYCERHAAIAHGQ